MKRNERMVAFCALISLAMFALIICEFIYGIVRASRGEKDAGLYGSFAIHLIFLLAPVIGIFSSIRMTKATDRFWRLAGWLMVASFSIFLLQAALITWVTFK